MIFLTNEHIASVLDMRNCIEGHLFPDFLIKIQLKISNLFG